MIARMFLLCRTSRMTIIKVRRTLSESEIEKYGIVGMEGMQSQTTPFDLAPW